MTVKELIEKLKDMPQECEVYAEGKEPDRVNLENCPDNRQIVRIFKTWNVEFTGNDFLRG